jgi:hypothetical protein
MSFTGFDDVNTFLKFSQIGISALAKGREYKEEVELRHKQFADVQQQAALNNQLLYNSYVNLNEREQLEYKKHAFDEFELQFDIRKAVAARLALQGLHNKSGGSAEAVVMNIKRQGLYSLQRKDFNYEVRLRNLQIQRNNEALETKSKNNALYNSLQGFPSATGLALSIGGSALQYASEWAKGRNLGDEGKKPPSGGSTAKPFKSSEHRVSAKDRSHFAQTTDPRLMGIPEGYKE